MAANVYRFGAFTLDTARSALRRGNEEVALRPKSFALLQYLVEHAGRLATKDELLAAVWPGVVVTEDSLTRCVSEVRAALGDGAQQTIRTVSRRGYLFAAEVAEQAAFDASTSAGVATPTPAETRPLPGGAAWRTRQLVVAGVLAATATIGIAAWWLVVRGSAAPPARLTVIVLPFTDLSADRNQGWLADIVTDDLTNALARLHGTTVISSSSAFSFRGKTVDLARLGSDLGVRYAVQGSVQRNGGRVRINARLFDLAGSKALWSDQFDLDRVELPRTQDEIVLRLANALDAELVAADTSRIAPAAGPALDAEDLAMQCEAASGLQQGESGTPSYALCEQSLQLDPKNVRALVRLALYYGNRVERMQSADPKADLALARDWVNRARAVAPRYFATHCANAVVLAQEHRVRDAMAEAEHCRALNPSHARAYRLLSTFHFYLAEPDRTLEYAEQGLRLAPRDFHTASFLLFKGWGHFMKGEDEEALVWMRKAAAASPDSPSILAPFSAVLALTGHLDEARATMARYLSLNRARNRTVAGWSRLPDDNPGFRDFVVRLQDGLRKAGMPEE